MGRVCLRREHPDAMIGHVVISDKSITFGTRFEARTEVLLKCRHFSLRGRAAHLLSLNRFCWTLRRTLGKRGRGRQEQRGYSDCRYRPHDHPTVMSGASSAFMPITL